MVEVFKTNVEDHQQAKILLEQIHKVFTGYKANFDLDDCDKILRVQSAGRVQTRSLISLLKDFGSAAEVLPD